MTINNGNVWGNDVKGGNFERKKTKSSTKEKESSNSSSKSCRMSITII